jgi:hypothetical protein
MSTYLRRTCTGGNQKIATFSAWVKKTQITQENCLFLQRADGSNFFRIRFNSDQINFNSRVSGSDVYGTTDAVFRDPSAFYHIVLTVDTTQNTEADRFKLYVNNSQQTFSASSYPSQDANLQMNVNSMQNDIGGENGFNYFKGLMTHIHWVDGTAYTPSTFGETDSTSGIWKPKTAPSVTYGTNGFFLKFENSGAMGTDSSGESNTFTPTGNLTQNVDTPTNNYATLNPLTGNCTLTNGNLSWDGTPSTYAHNSSTFGVSTGKWYWEHKPSHACASIGITDFDWEMQKRGALIYASGGQSYSYEGNGYVSHNTYGDMSSSYPSYSTEIIGVALDLVNNKLYFSKSGVWANSADPANNTNGITIDAPSTLTSGVYSPLVADLCSATVATGACNFGQGFFGTTAVSSANADANGHGAFEYTVPSGFYALNTKNIKEFG